MHTFAGVVTLYSPTGSKVLQLPFQQRTRTNVDFQTVAIRLTSDV